jgi:flagellar L-ring protein FlgH
MTLRQCSGALAAVATMAGFLMPATAADLEIKTEFVSLAADNKALKAGDILTIVIVENSSASNTADLTSDKSYGLSAEAVTVNPPRRYGGNLQLGDETQGRGRVQRTGRLAAQVSARVHQVLLNGDLLVRGDQEINVNGEKTRISIEGLVRPRDIASGNIVLSSRLADARIEYVGDGYLADRAKPGLIPRVVNWLGLW